MKLGAVSAQDQVTQLAISEMIKTVPFLARVEFAKTVAEAIAYKATDDMTATLKARAKDADYASSDNESRDPLTAAVKMLGMPITVDKLELQTHYDQPALKAKKILMAARVFAKQLAAIMHNGTGTNNKIKGLINLVDSSMVKSDTNGWDLRSTNGKRDFLESLDELIADIDPTCLTMNAKMFAIMQTIAREMHALTWSKNEFGKLIYAYNGVPMEVIPGAGITFTETKGSASGKCTSIYLPKFSDTDDLCYHTTVGADVTDVDLAEKDVIKNGNIELYGTPVIYNKKALGRISGLYI